MWSGGISGRNRVRPAGKWAQGLTCQTANPPPAIYNLLAAGFYLFIHRQAVNDIKVSFSERKFQVTRSQFKFFLSSVKTACGFAGNHCRDYFAGT
jgi:hypothetical protein